MKKDYKKYSIRAENITEFLKGKGNSHATATSIANIRVHETVAPWHGDDIWIIPNALARCGLFRVARTKAKRDFLQDHQFELYASRGGYVEYTGPELRQNDCDVFMALLQQELETPGLALVKLRSFAQKIGWGNSNQAVKKLEASIKRLSATNVEIRTHFPMEGKAATQTSGFSLVEGYTRESDSVWIVYLDRRLKKQAENSFAWISHKQLRQLPRGAEMASWLLRFIATHKEPIPFALDDLHRYSYSSSQPKEFTRLIKNAADRLLEIGFLTEFKVADGKLHVLRAPLEEVFDF